MRKCTRCGEIKEAIYFGKGQARSDGTRSACSECEAISTKAYYETERGICSRIYSRQRSSSRYRRHPMPDYNSIELFEWITSQDDWRRIYCDWVESGYDKYKTPSLDRINNDLPYSFSNIRLTTWRDNLSMSHKYRMNDGNICRPVIATCLKTGVEKRFHSVNEAARSGFLDGNIHKCCRGYRKTHRGYSWRFDLS